MDTIIEGLVQYGPLGMWTASLLWMNYQQRKENLINEAKAADALSFHQQQIVSELKDQQHKIEKCIEKLDFGLAQMKERNNEDRIRREIQSTKQMDTRQY